MSTDRVERQVVYVFNDRYSFVIFRYRQLLRYFSGFHHHWTCFRTKSSATYTHVLRHLQMHLIRIIFFFIFESIISRILNIVLNKTNQDLKNVYFK